MTFVLFLAYSPVVHYLIQPGPALADRFAYLVGGLCHCLGMIFTRDRTTGALTLAVDARLRRLRTRFALLVARVEAGTMRPARAPVAPRAGRVASPRSMPNGFGWLCRLMPEGNVYANYLEEQVLPDARLAAVLAASPRAGGMLRALLWMMGREVPENLRLAKAPRAKPVRPEPAPIPEIPYREQPPGSHYPSSVWPTKAQLERAGRRLARAERLRKSPV